MNIEIVKLMNRVMGSRAVYYNGSQITLWNVPMIFMPMITMAKLQKRLIDLKGFEEVYSVFTELGKIHGINATNILIKKFNIKPDMKDYSFYLAQAKQIGIGNIILELAEAEQHHCIISYSSSPEAIAYVSSFGIQKKPVDFFQNGLITGAAVALMGGDLYGVETNCAAKGDKNCVFEIKEKQEWLKDKTFSKYLPIEINEINEIKKKETLNALLAPVVIRNQTETVLSHLLKRKYQREFFDFSDSGITIAGVRGFITPAEIISILFYIIQKRWGTQSQNIIYEIGKEEGKIYSNYIRKILLLKDDYDGISRLIEFIGIKGMGKPEVLTYKPESNHFLIKVHDNFLAKKNLTLFGVQSYCVDVYLSGILAGLLSDIVQKDINITEKQCVSQGKEYCLFESK